MLQNNNNCYNAVKKCIFNEPHKMFYLRELSRITGFSTTAITTTLDILEKEKIITITEDNISKKIKANINAEEYRYNKMSYNLQRLIELNSIQEIKEKFSNPECIVLFGSFAKGEDIEQSDIDFFILSSLKKEIYWKKLLKIKEKIEKELFRKISFYVLPSLEKSEKEFKNALANGIVLHGYLKVV